MASDSKGSPVVGTPPPARDKGVRIFTYPKIIFIFPSLIMSMVCWVGMIMTPDAVDFNYRRAHHEEVKAAPATKGVPSTPAKVAAKDQAKDIDSILPIKPDPIAFKRKENVFGLLFLTVFFLNLMILAIDFPRFAIFGIILGGTTLLFFLLWLGFFVNILEPLVNVLQGVYVVANAEFYFLISVVFLAIYAIIFVTRWLDYWEILPNEILHHHGPLSDLERYPTLNLKFDKEIPDVFEHLMFGAGTVGAPRPDERKAIVLDTVLHVSRKEEASKKLMSRLEVRVTTDAECRTLIRDARAQAPRPAFRTVEGRWSVAAAWESSRRRPSGPRGAGPRHGSPRLSSSRIIPLRVSSRSTRRRAT